MSTADQLDQAMQIEQIHCHLGAEVSGLSLADGISDEDVLAIEQALAEYQVLVFRDQPMTLDGFTSPSNIAQGGAVTLTTSDPVLVTLPQAQLATALQAAARAE